MRWSIGYKIFCLFLPLTLVALLFGFIVFHNLSAIESNNTHILHLKDFQIHLKSLEAWKVRLVSRDVTLDKTEFLAEIAVTKKMASDIAAHQEGLPQPLEKRIKSFAVLSENFSKSYLELFQRYKFEMSLAEKTKSILEQIEAKAAEYSYSADILPTQHQLYHLVQDLVYSLRALQMKNYQYQDISSLYQDKRAVADSLVQVGDPHLDDLAEQVVGILEEGYFNYLAIQKRERNLAETAGYFFSVTEETVETIIERFVATSNSARIIILVITAFAILLNLFFWHTSNRYFKNFITTQNKAIQSIAKGNYDFRLKFMPNDEIGDLSRMMECMAVKFKESQSQLRRSEMKYKNLVENLDDILWALDSNNRIIFISIAVRKMLGFTPEELLGTSFTDLLHPEETSGKKDELSRYFKKQIPFEKTLFFKNINNEIKILDVSAQPVFQASVFLGFRGMSRDVTEKKQLEQQLQQSQKMEAVGRLAGGVAHDYNNMLSIIIGYTELALESVTPEQSLHSDLKAIYAAASRSMDITRQLLAFARKQAIVPRILEMNETISGMLKMLQRLIGENINLAWLPGINLWQVKMDPSQLDQVLANLCLNARDAITGVGNITIATKNVTIEDNYIQANQTIIPGEYVLLKIIDDGCGMDSKTSEQIFEPFFSTKGDMGNGLGLATVYGIVQQNKGVIHVYSEPGHGTTFNLYIPRYKKPAESQKSIEQLKQLPESQGETILLVEDEEVITKLVKRMLEKLGYKLLAANTPLEALELMAESEIVPQLLITDVVMPEMNGKELAQRMSELYPEMRILYMSGYTADVIADQGVIHDGVNFIEKPFSKAEIAFKVREVIDQS